MSKIDSHRTGPALHTVDVYVDDFLAASQGNRWTRRAAKRLLFTALDQVFRPLDSTDSVFRQQPASLKKLKKGDGTWATSKVILGWLVDTVNKTITLALHQRAYRYVPLRDYIPGPSNAMADDLSRRWDLTDTQLLSYFNTQYPQDVPWCLCPLRPTMTSNLTLALSQRPCE